MRKSRAFYALLEFWRWRLHKEAARNVKWQAPKELAPPPENISFLATMIGSKLRRGVFDIKKIEEAGLVPRLSLDSERWTNLHEDISFDPRIISIMSYLTESKKPGYALLMTAKSGNDLYIYREEPYALNIISGVQRILQASSEWVFYLDNLGVLCVWNRSWDEVIKLFFIAGYKNDPVHSFAAIISARPGETHVHISITSIISGGMWVITQAISLNPTEGVSLGERKIRDVINTKIVTPCWINNTLAAKSWLEGGRPGGEIEIAKVWGKLGLSSNSSWKKLGEVSGYVLALEAFPTAQSRKGQEGEPPKQRLFVTHKRIRNLMISFPNVLDFEGLVECAYVHAGSGGFFLNLTFEWLAERVTYPTWTSIPKNDPRWLFLDDAISHPVTGRER